MSKKNEKRMDCMAMEKSVIPLLIEEFHGIFDMTIEEDRVGFREYRFNIALFLLEMYDELGKLPYHPYLVV